MPTMYRRRKPIQPAVINTKSSRFFRDLMWMLVGMLVVLGIGHLIARFG